MLADSKSGFNSLDITRQICPANLDLESIESEVDVAAKFVLQTLQAVLA